MIQANRNIGIILITVIFALLWIFGFAGEYRKITANTDPVNFTSQPIFVSIFVLTCLFSILGFGLLFMYFKKMTESAMFTSLFVVSMSMLLSPMFEKFWYNAFIAGFSGSSGSGTSDYFFNQSLGGHLIYFDFYNMKISLLCAISQLVVMLAIYGRLSLIQIITFSFVYNIFWSLNYFALVNVQSKSPDAPDHRFYDDNSISSVYLYAACYGVFSFIFIKKPPKEE